ncbi:MAG: tetratricopeptide repeat protein [Phycisphaeraceae bacterium]|nr:tetratricopeptide repeat protein [Phycisphaeraceae bacterium]
MASKVNTRFVVILVGVLVLLAAGGVLAARFALQKSAGDYIKLGDEASAAGDFSRAAGYYGVAVNKDQANVEYLKKWIEALSRTSPTTMQQYRDMYQREYRLALAGLAQADRGSYDSQVRYLAEWYEVLTSFPASLGDWEELAVLTAQSMERFDGTESERKRIGRYRGLALASALQLKGRRTPEEFQSAKEYLLAAIEADPEDEESVLALAGVELLEAQEARDRAEGGKADEIIRGVQRRLAEHVRDHPPAPGAALRLYQLRYSESTRSAPRGTTVRQAIEEIKDHLDSAVAAFEAAPAESIDGRQALQLSVSGGEMFDDLRPRVREVIRRVDSAQAANSRFLRAYGEVLLSTGQIDEAVEVFDRVAKLPRPPLSLRGLVLEQDRAMAVSGQAEAMFLAWQRATAVPERERLTGRLKEYRDALAALIGENESRVAALDARLAFIKGDIAGARTLITKYNEQTARSDATSVLLEAEIMRRLGNDGSAKEAYQRALRLQPGNTRALLSLADMEAADRNYREALVHLDLAVERLPTDTDLAKRRDEIKKLVDGTDPVLTEMLRIEREHLMGVGRNIPAAVAELNKLMVSSRDDARVAAVLATVLAADNKRDEALAIARRGLSKTPDHEPLKALVARLTAADPLQDQLAAVDNMVLTDVQKNIRKFEILARVGRREDARQYLEAAARLDPEFPAVVEYQFLEALAAGDKPQLERLVAVAERKNLDQLNGVTFRVRRDLARVQEFRADARAKEQSGDDVAAARLRSEAIDLLRSSRVLLRQITQADRTNLIAWRLLGAVDLELSDPAAAVDSFSKAVAIRPDDVSSIIGYLRALTATGALDRALDFARKSESAASGSEEFRAVWLALESDGPGGDRSKALEVRRSIASREPDNIQNRMALALLLMNTRNWDEASAEIGRVRERGAVGSAVALQAQLDVMRGEPQKAVDAYTAFIESIPEGQRTIGPYLEAARLMRRINQMNAAMAFYQGGRQYQDPKAMEVDREVGDVMYSLRAYQDAVRIYEQILDAGFKDDRDLVLARIVEGYLNLGQADKAQQAMARAGERVASNATMLMLSARIAAAQDDRARARRLLDQAVAADRTNPTVYVARADFNQVDPQLQRDVEADLVEALRLAPAYSPARVRLVQMFAAQGNQNEAIRQLREAVAADPLNDQVRMALIEALVSTNRGDEAAVVVEDTLRVRPDDLQWMMRGAQILMQLRKQQRALDLAQRAWDKSREIIPASLYVQMLLSVEPPDTRTAFRVLESRELNTDRNIDARLLRARVHLKAGNAPRAFEDVSAAVGLIDQTRPEMIRAFFTVLPDVYPEVRDRIAAVNSLEQNRAFDGWMRFFASLTRLQDPITEERGKSELTQLYEAAEDSSVKFACAGTLGSMAYQAKQFEEAVRWYRRALEINANDPEVNNNLAYTLASELGRAEEAVPHAERAVSVLPENPMLLDTLGVAYLGINDLEKAGMALMRAWSRATRPEERLPILVHMGQVRAREKNKAELAKVIEMLDQLIKAHPGVETPYVSQIGQLRQATD